MSVQTTNLGQVFAMVGVPLINTFELASKTEIMWGCLGLPRPHNHRDLGYFRAVNFLRYRVSQAVRLTTQSSLGMVMSYGNTVRDSFHQPWASHTPRISNVLLGKLSINENTHTRYI